MTNDELSARVAEARGEKDADLGYFKIDENWYGEKPRPYASDMNAALELESDITAAGCRVEIQAWPDGMHYVSIYSVDEVYEQMIADGEGATMPDAICRAYLAFKGVEI